MNKTSDAQLVDTHAHLQSNRYSKDLELVISRTQQANMKVIVIGWDLESSQRAIELASQYEFIYATVGLSHYCANDMNDDLLNDLSQLAQKEEVVAIGETGLDYYRMAASIPSQKRLFRAQVQLAFSSSLPLVIHDRDAHKDIVTILKEEEAHEGVIHCFSGDEDMLKDVLDIDFYISLSGIITFSKPLAQLIKQLPLDRLLVETDSPYLAPVPKRGKRNEPSYLKYIVQKISEILDLTYEEVVQINETNANNLFKLKD